MPQDSPEDTPGWTGGAQGGAPRRPGWPQPDPHGRPARSAAPQPGEPPRPQYTQPQYGQQQPQYGQQQPPYGQQQYGHQYGQPQYGQQPQYGNQYAPPSGPAYPQAGYQAAPGVPGPGPAGYYGPPSQSDDRTWAMLGYLLTFVGGFIAPLIVYLVKKDESPFVRHHAAQALNLAITSAIYSIGLFVLAIIAGAVSHGLGLLLVLLYFPLGIAFAVYLIMAAVAANRFEMYQVPSWACLRLVH